MKLFISQQNYTIGDFKGNTEKIIAAIGEAEAQNADLAVFSEMCVCGSFAEDLFLSEDFIQKSLDSLREIQKHIGKTAVIIGAPERNPGRSGKQVFNAAYFIQQQQVKHIARKTVLFDFLNDETRYFEPATDRESFSYLGKKIVLAIGQDISCSSEQSPASHQLLTDLDQIKADIVIHISALPFNYRSDKETVLKQFALNHEAVLVHCNAAGGQGGTILEGHSMVINPAGQLVIEARRFVEENVSLNLTENPVSAFSSGVKLKSSAGSPEFDANLHIHHIRAAIIAGIRDYFSKTGFRKAILGNSGGIDSAVSIALTAEALGSENVFSLLMPSPYSSEHSISDGEQLCKNLKTPYQIIPIQKVFESFKEMLVPLFAGRKEDVTEENLQARIRGSLLMSVANKFGYVLLNTSNKSELSVGYGTLYGDLAGGLSLLGDCYKQQVYALAHDINSEQEIIPENILHKLPSAELRPGQYDQEAIPPYDVLDSILYNLIERNLSEEEIQAPDIDGEMLSHALKLVKRNEFKRHQFCPILQVSPMPFGTGRKMPVVMK